MIVRTPLRVLAVSLSLIAVTTGHALEAISEEEMSDSTGTGLGFVLDDFKLVADPATYVRVTSAGGTPATIGKKADMYLYGLSVGGANGSNDANVNGGTLGTVDNPVVFDAKTVDGKSTLMLNMPSVADGTHPANSKPGQNLKLVTQVDILPRDSLVFTPQTGGNPNYLRMQIMANKVSLDGTKVNVLETGDFDAGTAVTTGVAAYDQGLAQERERMQVAYSNKVANYGKLRINYETDGFFRWSVAQNSGSIGTDPVAVNNTNPLGNGYGAYVTNNPGTYNNQEGLFVEDFQVNMPLGSSFQPTILDTNGDGSIVLELARIPNDPAVYQKQYINYADKTFANVATGQNTTLTFDAANRSLIEGSNTFTEAVTPNVTALTQAQGYCTPTSCPETATHATAYFRTFTHDVNGQSSKDYSSVAPNPLVPYEYRGYGVRPLATDTSGSAGIGLNGALSDMSANPAPTYNFAEGMVVNHLKVTLNQ